MSLDVRHRPDDNSGRRQSSRASWSMLGSSSSFEPRASTAPTPVPPPTISEIKPERKVTARSNDGVVVISGVADLLRRLPDSPARQVPDNAASNEQQNIIDDDTLLIDVSASHAIPEIDEEGPNDRGTYSKEYTLRHPEIQWTHRGQGRYLPTTSIKPSLSATNSQRSRESEFSEQRRSSVGDRRSFGLLEANDIDRARLSPYSTRGLESTYSLRQKQSLPEPTAAERRAARISRRVGTLNDDAQSHASDSSEDEAKTYTKSHVDAHPEAQWKHCGNGFHRKLSSTRANAESRSSRRDSSRSFARSDISPTTAMSQTVHASELKNYPGERFTHRGNGYYRRESAVSQSRDPHSGSEGEDSEPDMAVTTFSKEEADEYKRLHPNAIMVHRGNGRYKTLDTIAGDQAKTTATIPEDDLKGSRRASGDQNDDYRRKSGSGNLSMVSSGGDANGLPTGLVDKKYVEDHPELVFHHRGQGRWALGPRTKSENAASEAGSETPAPKDTKEMLYDRAYVDAHPNETFHHRGQGKWKRGLPPPGSSNKMAIRGPGLQSSKSSSSVTSSQSIAGANEDMPGLYELVAKVEGPERWPNQKWHYRGGGKWSRSTKDEAEKATRTSRVRGRQFDVNDLDTDVDIESNATESRRGSIYDVAQPRLKRKHSALQAFDSLDPFTRPNISQSTTPKPPILTLEQDPLTDADLPELYRDEWSPIGPDDDNDEAAHLMRTIYKPLTPAEDFINLLTKYDPAIRPTENLRRIAEHVNEAIRKIQDEYLELDKITAPHARIPRKLATGGRLPVDMQIFEDRKEAELYDYLFDPKKVGYQNPELQQITRDADGRELRKRHRRMGNDAEVSAQIEEPLGRRVVKPVSRFDGTPGSTTRRRRRPDNEGSVTPERVATPEKPTVNLQALAEGYVAPTSGRWAGHVPKRIRELRGDSVGPSRSTEEQDEEDGHGEETEVLPDADSTRRAKIVTAGEGMRGIRRPRVLDYMEEEDVDMMSPSSETGVTDLLE